MPLIPASLSNLNQKVESVRKNFNSNLDKAGEKTGVFKPTSNSSSSSKPTANNLYHQAPPPSYHPPPPPRPAPPTISYHPPPPPRPAPPPTRHHAPINHLKPTPPPPPPRKVSHLSQSEPQPEHVSYDSPPPVASKPPTPYRPPPTTINGYGPPSFPPVQPSSRYGPPSPPRSPSQDQHPPLPVSSNKSANWNKPIPVSQPKTPARSMAGAKHGQIPFPPFSQFTYKDKQAFFEMLDEFFSMKLPDRMPNKGPIKGDSQPPVVALHTRPSNQVAVNLNESEPSRAESLARYIKNFRQWSSHSDQWYAADDPVPTPEQTSQDLRRMSCWNQTGNKRTQINYILFPDLSQIWTQVSFDVHRPFPPQSANAKYRPPPAQIDPQTMIEAPQIYGTEIVSFAENAERSGRHVARGECWDLANEALKAFPANQLGVPPPLTSISRTHGILLYHGNASSQGYGVGSWKQFNDFGVIRPGDIIEWRLVACDTINPILSCTLGDPDHTAIIVDARGCTINENGYQDNCPPHQLGHITVVEQSLRQIPVRRTYNLSTMSRGEVWIYRPMAEQTLLGHGANECSFPPPPPSFEV